MRKELVAARRACADTENTALLLVDIGKNVLQVIFPARDILRKGKDKLASACKAQSGFAVKKRGVIITLQPLNMVGKRLL